MVDYEIKDTYMRYLGILILAAMIAVTTSGLMFATEANSSEYQDRYIIASKTWQNVVPTRYNAIYKDVKRVDKSAARTMVTAARETCLNTVTPNPRFVGPNQDSRHPAFDCYTAWR